MRSLYYEDVKVGAQFIVPGRTVVETDIISFATVSGDSHPIHTDAAYAARTEFGQRIAHGPLGIAIAIGLFGRIPEFSDTAVAMLGVSEWKFCAPVFIGDTLRLEMTVAAKRLTKSGRGIIDRHMKLVKQDDTIVQEGNTELLIARRP